MPPDVPLDVLSNVPFGKELLNMPPDVPLLPGRICPFVCWFIGGGAGAVLTISVTSAAVALPAVVNFDATVALQAIIDVAATVVHPPINEWSGRDEVAVY